MVFITLAKRFPLKNFLIERSEEAKKLYIAHLSIDCVIFGFNNDVLKILLVRLKNSQLCSLPGGFLLKEEKNFDTAAARILKSRTGAEDVFMAQFSSFSEYDRAGNTFKDYPDDFWNKQRFITVGYYALVNFDTIIPVVDEISDFCEWVDADTIPAMIMDHKEIIDTALQTLRKEINYKPIGLNLLSSEFTMLELQRLYEAILGIKLNRGNFYRKIISFDILINLGKSQKEGVHKSSIFYRFDIDKYNEAVKNGFKQMW